MTLLLKRRFDDFKQNNDQHVHSEQHWYDMRKTIFKQTVDEWNSCSSPTSLARKRKLSAEAKTINADAMQTRMNQLESCQRNAREKTHDAYSIAELQSDLVKSALQGGVL